MSAAFFEVMLKQSEFYKIRVTVPTAHANAVQKALGDAGAGKIGAYSHCSFAYPVKGQFKPEEGAKPAIGEVGKLESVEEVLVEALCHQDIIESVYAAVVAAHPYEEPAIDIMPRYDVE